VFHGWVLAVQGQAAAGVTAIQQGLAAYRATQAELSRPYFLGVLAEAYGHHRRPDLGLQALADAVTLVHATGERFYEAEIYRLQGELLLAQTGTRRHTTGKSIHEADVCFQRALQIARRQQARAFELRAAVSLSRLWHQQGKAMPARRLLGEVYGWFSEGFETRDLQEASALLDVLQSPGA
jgi:predicted ATPase